MSAAMLTAQILDQSFAPQAKGTRLVAAGTVSANIPLSLGNQVRVVVGVADCRIEFGKANTVTAQAPVAGGAAGSMLLKAGSIEVLTVPSGTEFVAYATDAGTGTLELTPGIGL